MKRRPEIKTLSVSNIFTRMMFFKDVGDCETYSSNPHDSFLLLSNGKIDIEVDNKVSSFEAPHIIVIKKNKNPKIISKSQSAIAWDIYALRDAKGKVIDSDSIPDNVDVTELGIPEDLF